MTSPSSNSPGAAQAHADREHWLIERELRERLLAAPAADRERVAAEVYDELFRRVSWHHANTADRSEELRHEDRFFAVWHRVVPPGATMVDLGCGNGALQERFAGRVARSIGVEASAGMVEASAARGIGGAEFVCGSVLDPPLDAGIADVVISRHVIEHLHPDDGGRHIAAAFRLLRPGGVFLIETPNGLTGPWDCSRGFTDTPTGLHLHEYTIRELSDALAQAGFGAMHGLLAPAKALVRIPARVGEHAPMHVPLSVKRAEERLVSALPGGARATVAGVLGVTNIGIAARRPGDGGATR